MATTWMMPFHEYVRNLPGVKVVSRYGCTVWLAYGKRIAWEWPITPADSKRVAAEGLEKVSIAIPLREVPTRRGFYSSKGLRAALVAFTEADAKDVRAAIRVAYEGARPPTKRAAAADKKPARRAPSRRRRGSSR